MLQTPAMQVLVLELKKWDARMRTHYDNAHDDTTQAEHDALENKALAAMHVMNVFSDVLWEERMTADNLDVITFSNGAQYP